MKRHLLILFAALLPLMTNAHDFEVGGIYYNITSEADKTAEVTFRGNYYNNYTNEYSGSITLPATVTHNGVAYSVTSIGERAFYDCSSLAAITLPEGVTSIGEDAFYYCSSLTAITIPEGVTSIGYDAFYGCSSLERVTINCANVGNWFSGLSSIKEIVLGASVTSIRDEAFQGCSSLTAINIPEGVTSIGDGAFRGCSSLTDLSVAEGNTIYDSRGGCNAIIETNSNTLISGCATTIIPESVTSIGNYAFKGCSSLTSITIPESVTSFGNSAFCDCSSLKELTLGKGLKKIGVAAFYGCDEIEKVTTYATRPPTAADINIFSDATYENATLYVPQGCIDKYEVMTGWSGFYTIEEMEGGTPNYLTLRQADNGEVGIVVELGRTYKVRITAFEGWKIHSVTFNGEEVTDHLTEEGTFTTPALQADAVLNIAYEKIEASTTVTSAQTNRIKVQGHQGTLRITGATEGDDISVYTTDGMLVAQESAEDGETLLTLPTGQVYIVTVADMVVKIGM